MEFSWFHQLLKKNLPFCLQLNTLLATKKSNDPLYEVFRDVRQKNKCLFDSLNFSRQTNVQSQLGAKMLDIFIVKWNFHMAITSKQGVIDLLQTQRSCLNENGTWNPKIKNAENIISFCKIFSKFWFIGSDMSITATWSFPVILGNFVFSPIWKVLINFFLHDDIIVKNDISTLVQERRLFIWEKYGGSERMRWRVPLPDWLAAWYSIQASTRPFLHFLSGGRWLSYLIRAV